MLTRHVRTALILACLAVSSVTAQSTAYVSNVSGNNVSVIDTTSNTVTGMIPVPGGPTGMGVTPDGSLLFVASQNTGAVTVVDTATNAVVATLQAGAGVTQLAVSPNGKLVLVVRPAANAISVIDVEARAVVGAIPVGTKPAAVAFNSGGTRAYVANVLSGNISVIDTATRAVVSTITTASGPSGVAVSPDGRLLYVTNQYAGSLTVHDTDTGTAVKTITGFSFPNWISLTPNGARAFVTNGNAGSVSIVDTGAGTIAKTLATGSLPTSVAISYDGTRAYVTNQYSFSLTVIDTATLAIVTAISKVGVYPLVVATRPGTANLVIPTPPPVPTCTYTVSPGLASYNAGGGTGALSVTAAQGCAWRVVNAPEWMSLSPANGSGPGQVTYTVNPNTAQEGRSATLEVAGQQVTISQGALVCSYVLSASNTAVAAAGGAGAVNVNAPAGCAWTAASDSPWLRLVNTTASQGSGAGVVNFTADANAGLAARTGNLTIGGQTVPVTQAGVAFNPIRVNCGGLAMTDSRGNVWAADDRGNRTITTAPILNTTDPGLFQKEAWSTSTLQYQFDVPNGSLGVTLHFAEIYHTEIGQRVFNIVINGTPVATNFDILANVSGPNKAISKTFYTTVSNGRLAIELVPVVGTVKISGIEIQ